MGPQGGTRRAAGNDRSAEDRGAGAPAGAFPVVVTMLSLLLALGLFFQSTAPALQERQELREVEAEKQSRLRDLFRQTTALALRRTALEWDVQTILVELDRQGIYPAAILAQARARAGARQHGADPQ